MTPVSAISPTPTRSEDTFLSGDCQLYFSTGSLARGRLRAKLPDLRQALIGRVQPHHRFLLQRILAHIDFLEYSIGQVEDEVEQRLLPFFAPVHAGKGTIGSAKSKIEEDVVWPIY